MMVEKSLASQLQIGPLYKQEVRRTDAKDKLVLCAAIFATIVGIATSDLKPQSLLSQKIKSGLISKSNQDQHLEVQDAEYRHIPDSSKRELASHIAKTWKVGVIRASQVVKMADEAGYQTNVDPIIVLAVIANESSFNPTAKSHVGAEGLMQVWRKWHPEKFHGISQATPQQNILIGSSILKEYLDIEGGEIVPALQRYNGAKDDPTYYYANKVLTIKSTFDSIHISQRDQKTLMRNS